MNQIPVYVQWRFIHLTALTAHIWAALMCGRPLALGGLHGCGQALAQGQRNLRRRCVSRARGG